MLNLAQGAGKRAGSRRARAFTGEDPPRFRMTFVSFVSFAEAEKGLPAMLDVLDLCGAWRAPRRLSVRGRAVRGRAVGGRRQARRKPPFTSAPYIANAARNPI
jgi:hypothetical protein